jgi:DNA topoisomerase-1
MNFDEQGKPVISAQATQYTCDKCGKPIILREGRSGKFLGCSGYPKCKSTKEVDAQGRPVQPVDTGIRCEKCNSPMILRKGFRGPFLGCSGYPKCRSTKPMTAELKEKFKDQMPAPQPKKEVPKVDVRETCPECGAPMVLREGKRGYFLGCTKFKSGKCKGTREAPPELLEQLQEAVG